MADTFEKRGQFHKVDDDGVIYGWALVCTEKGERYVDLQGDHVPDDVMVAAAIDFASNSRVGKDMHDGGQVADVLFTYPVTKGSSHLGGLPSEKTGLLIGYKPSDPELIAAVKRGERTGFSIGGVLSEHDGVGKALAKAAGKPNQLKRTFRSFKIHEISLVDVPAMEGATVGYVKRAIATRTRETVKRALFPRATSKAAVLTSLVDGHQHTLDPNDPATSCWGLSTSYQTADGAESGHSHPWVYDATGAITIAADSGHTHTVDAVVSAAAIASATARAAAEQAAIAAVPTAVVDEPSDGIPTAVADEESSGKTINVLIAARAPAQISTRPIAVSTLTSHPESTMADPIKTETVTKTIAVALSEAQLAFYKSLGTTEGETFLAKSWTERESLTVAAEKADEVVYTSKSTGEVFRKSDDPRMVSMAKRQDEHVTELAKRDEAIEKAEVANIAKALFPGMAGDDETHQYIVRQLRKGGDAAQLEKAYAAIKAWRKATDELGKPKGIDGAGNGVGDETGGDPWEVFKAAEAKFVATYVAKNTNAKPGAAQDAFLNAPEGKAAKAAYDATRRYGQ